MRQFKAYSVALRESALLKEKLKLYKLAKECICMVAIESYMPSNEPVKYPWLALYQCQIKTMHVNVDAFKD